MVTINNRKSDKKSYDEEYRDLDSKFIELSNIPEYIEAYRAKRLQPYHLGGNEKGFALDQAIRGLISEVGEAETPTDISILDAGCGQGELSTYLACLGYDVTGVDISREGCKAAERLSKRIGVDGKCRFLPNSLESISIETSSIDCIIGYGALHHFIKYEGVPAELERVLKSGGVGYFVDSFGENKLYHLFHDKDKMTRLGDVTLTRRLVVEYFEKFDVTLTPVNWFTMIDKIFARKRLRDILPHSARMQLAGFNHRTDRHIPTSSRIALFLSGCIITKIRRD